jgi:hypothetical protein
MIRRISILLALVSSTAAAFAAPDTRTVIYRSPFLPPPKSGAVFDLAKNIHGAIGAHQLYHFETCEASSPFNCLTMIEFDFALSVPKQGMLEGSTWRIGKYRFVIRHGGLMPFQGRRLSYSVIDTIVDGAPEDHAMIRAMYDPKFGLVCFTHLNWKDPDTGEERPYEEEVNTICAEDIGLWPRAK